MSTKQSNHLLSNLTRILGVCGLVMLTNVNANLISQDLSTPGDGHLTYDSATGLSWLDVTLTGNHSYNEVISGYEGYTTTLGFRYATGDELGRLFSDAGVVEGTIWGYWDFSNPYFLASYNLVSLLGITYPFDGLTTETIGLIGSTVESPVGYHDYAVVGYNNHADSGSFHDVGNSSFTDSAVSPYVGSFLVKDSTPVPEPASISLIGIGLAGLIGACRKKKWGTARCCGPRNA